MIRDFVNGRKSRNSTELLANNVHMCYNRENQNKSPNGAFCIISKTTNTIHYEGKIMQNEYFKDTTSFVAWYKTKQYWDFEIMISAEGDIAYATPSHQEFLIARSCEKRCMSRDELMEACPPEYHFDFLKWLVDQCGWIPVWENGVLNYPITKKQRTVLRKFKILGLFRGAIPKLRE